MERKRAIVIGSGIGGMTLAMLLARSGTEVTVVEAAGHIGGLMQRFKRRGVPFDTGFHFTGNFDNSLGQMLRVLGIDDMVKEKPFAHHIYLGETGNEFSLPRGTENIRRYLHERFPAEAAKVDAFYEMEDAVAAQIAYFDIRGKLLDMPDEYYETTTLDEFFDAHGIDGELRAILSSYAMCHGSPPCEASLNLHGRISYGFNSRMSQVVGGGGVFIDAFDREAAKYGIRVVTSARIERLDVEGNICRRAQLTTGETLAFDEAFFTAHPCELAVLLPDTPRTQLFNKKIEQSKDTCGFFTVFAVVHDEAFEPRLSSYLSVSDCNEILLPGGKGHSTAMVFTREEGEDCLIGTTAQPVSDATSPLATANKSIIQSVNNSILTLSAFSTVFAAETRRWEHLTLAQRHKNAEYQEYKKQKTADILADVYKVHPDLRGKIEIAADAGQDEVEKAALAEANIARQLEKLTVRKVLHVPGKLLNIVAN